MIWRMHASERVLGAYSYEMHSVTDSRQVLVCISITIQTPALDNMQKCLGA